MPRQKRFLFVSAINSYNKLNHSLQPQLDFHCVFYHIVVKKIFTVCDLTTGGAVRDGSKTDLHEAPAWEPLHAGKRLLQNPVG